jgi:hypothetical protein
LRSPKHQRRERRWPRGGRAGARMEAGAMKPDLAVQLENAAFALLAGSTILLGVPALSRLMGLG